MSAFVVLDPQGKPLSVGTVVAQLPAGCTKVTITEADFQAVCNGDKRITDGGTLVDTGRAQQAANLATVQQRAQAYLGLPTPTNAQNVKAIHGLVRLALGLVDDISDT